MKSKLILGLFLLGLLACRTPRNLYNLPAFTEKGHLQAVIEIPAGTNYKYEFSKEENKFLIDKRYGRERKIDFLPFPGNYGFIPSTFSNPRKGGDGDALDVLVICETMETGSTIEIIPLGMLKLIDEGEEDYKIIAVPVAEHQRIIKAKNFEEFTKNYPEAKQILETWFRFYDRENTLEIKGWGNEKEAISEVKKSQKPS